MNNIRKWISLMIAILIYYVIHEGSHFLVALFYNASPEIKILGPGMQVLINDNLSNIERAIFCISGCISTLIIGYILVIFSRKIILKMNKYVKAICYYLTLVLLLLDPLYLSVLYRFFGGGDMNGIVLFGIKEIMMEIFFGIIFMFNIILFIRLVYPLYKKSFLDNLL